MSYLPIAGCCKSEQVFSYNNRIQYSDYCNQTNTISQIIGRQKRLFFTQNMSICSSLKSMLSSRLSSCSTTSTPAKNSLRDITRSLRQETRIHVTCFLMDFLQASKHSPLVEQKKISSSNYLLSIEYILIIKPFFF